MLPDELTLRDEPRTLLAAANILRARGNYFASAAVVNALRDLDPDFVMPEITREKLDWLRAMISEVREMDDHEDPTAVLECIWNVEALAVDLERLVVPEPVPVACASRNDDPNIPF